MPVTDPLREEHAHLRPHLDELDALADGLDTWTDNTPARLDAVLDFLRGHLVPHARAEEDVLYPAVERAMAAPGATSTMVADHREIVRRTDELAVSAAAGPAAAPTLRRQLYGLRAILDLHFDKEEEVLLPVLDAQLTAEQAERLFAEMSAEVPSLKGVS
jgi:iron-sulfur cluster repair protein YtfE (RIC family)